MPHANIVSVQGLQKTYFDHWHRPKVRALQGIDFEVKKGEVFGLLGPNGSGKSTTIKLMLGLLRPTSGNVLVLGRRPDDIQTKNRIGYLPEETHLYPHLNSLETLDFFGRLFCLPSNIRKERSEQLLQMVGLWPVRERRVGEYSKGMARRLGIAQALINDPDLVILDEPTSGLDPIGCREVKDLLISLAKKGKTIFMTSHLLADIEDVCTSIVILNKGAVLAKGEISELLTVPDSAQITISRLDDSEKEKILKLLHKSHTEDQISFTRPMRRLETFFIEALNSQSRLDKTQEQALQPEPAKEQSRTNAGQETSEDIIERLSRDDG